MIILANKPKGRTSNDVVQYIKHFTKSKKCGHAGTLDPMATGLMILATDDDTKKLHDLTGKDKSYLATIDLSKVSDTRDMEYREQFTQYEYDDNGLLIDWVHKTWPSIDQIQQQLWIMNSEQWTILPVPPFSAKKINGQKRYDLARSGQQEIVMQEMNINDIQIILYQAPELKISCHVWSWAYIRSIAYWLGKQLGTWGILTSLARTSIGDYTLDQIINPPSDSKVPFVVI